MIKDRFSWAIVACALALGTTGCSNTVRHMTATKWISSSGPAPAPAAAPVAPAAAPAASDDGRALYVTFWEGTCSSGVLGIGKGCSLGNSKIRRCNVKTDNTLVCVDEAEANRALARQQPQ